MFWGQILKNNQITTLSSKTTRVLNITNAILVKHGDKDRIYLQLANEKIRIIIGVFLVNKKEVLTLNSKLLLSSVEEYKISIINGDNSEVHISGFYETDEEEEKSISSEPIKIIETEEIINNIEGSQETDSDIDNNEIENFLQRKTKTEYDSKPRKLQKLAHKNKTGKQGYSKEKLLKKLRNNL